tara:strand:+ start:272 stop:1096 length:825 start_codon:yes stop_codon:yes gene_type:complete
MSKARTLANLMSDNAELADGQISVAEVVGAAPLASPTFTGTATGAAFSGPLTGNVTGNVTGNITGDITGKLTGSEINVSAISTTISDTAVDVFVYDTSKDSDGGAWRHKTQHTSWYNETLSTSTRGSRKEFPAVAVIVAEVAKVTIYDGDDPDMPMWMVFNQPTDSTVNFMASSGKTVSVIRMLNGNLCIGFSDGGWGVSQISFISDSQRWLWSGSIYYQLTNSVSERNSYSNYAQLESFGILGGLISDIAMTVLPNTLTNYATELPVPVLLVS